jgi:hypothetical protein
MKKFFFIVSLVLVTSVRLFAQDDDDNDGGNEKIRDKMSEFIQKRLNLSNDEATKFTPIFIKYFKEWRQTLRENKGDKLVLQQKIIDLRLRFRPQFREIIGEDRGNQVYQHQDVFIKELRDIRGRRMQNNPNRPLKRPNAVRSLL